MKMAAVVALLFVASCGGGGDGGGGGAGAGGNGNSATGTYSCQVAFPGADGGAGMTALCQEISGGTTQDMASIRQQCSAQAGTFMSDPCPRAGALGGCRETATAAPGVAITTWYYTDGSSTSADIQSLCEGLSGVAPAGLKVEFVAP
jgi:hypothetical protein